MMKKNMLAAVAFAALLASGSAMAQGAYIGGSFGPTSFDVDCSGTSNCEDSDTGYKLYGGYSFGNGFALEANYFNFGAVKATVPTYYYGTLDGEFKGTAVGVGVAVTGDFSSVVSGTARLGVSQNKMRVTVRQRGTNASTSEDETNTTAYFGLALGFRVAAGLSIVASADFTPFESEGETMNARLFGVGVKYQF